MQHKHLQRVFKALHKQGLDVSHDGTAYRVKRIGQAEELTAEVLLPLNFPLEAKALKQLAAFMSVSHPAGGHVCHACATPDFHPGEIVPVGSVVATTPDLVIPQAIGTDINCGMRLHVADIPFDAFQARKAELVEKLKGDLLLGTRNLPMPVNAMRGMFVGGAMAWLLEVASDPLGQLARSDMAQLERELSSIYHQGSEAGDARFAPENLLPDHRDVIRDESLATVGGGNHFVEIQVVDEILDRHEAFRLGIRAGQMAVMVHSGSRAVGQYVGREWMDRARALWPKDQKHPETGIFALHGDEARKYLRAMNTAANYAYVNRLLIGELVRLRLREIFGQVEAPLVYDVPHNIIFEENGLNVHRKGATPAHEGQLLLIPGSMGHSSFLLKGFGAARFLSSASHGAGRAVTRFDMGRKRIDEATLGLTGVECITLREERRIEEAPAAYKPIGPVVDTQINAGILSGVARLRPLLTFKA